MTLLRHKRATLLNVEPLKKIAVFHITVMFRIFKTQDRTIKITVIVSIDLDMFKFYQFYYL